MEPENRLHRLSVIMMIARIFKLEMID